MPLVYAARWDFWSGDNTSSQMQTYTEQTRHEESPGGKMKMKGSDAGRSVLCIFWSDDTCSAFRLAVQDQLL